MPLRTSAHFLYHALRGLLRLTTRPVRRDRHLHGYAIQPFRGYGTATEVLLKGRVFRQPKAGAHLPAGSMRRDVADLLRRVARWGLGDAEIVAHLHGAHTVVRTDRDGYFRVELALPEPLPEDRRWHEVHLELRHRGGTVREVGEVFVPPPQARFVVVSDIDDTVVLTGVANTATMMVRLFLQDAERRTAFPGVAPLYRALYHGASGDEQNPMLYVSRGPWSIYEVLERFFQLHRIPEGPILFLREWGLTLQRPLPKRATEHKHDLIEEMLAHYADLPFVLIGDSGQHDPEVYAEFVRRYPERVLAVYIRNVSRSGSRDAEIEALAREVAAAGSALVLSADSVGMAEHAAELGLIAPDAVEEVRAEREAQQGGPEHEAHTADADRVGEALDAPSEDAQPPTVVVDR